MTSRRPPKKRAYRMSARADAAATTTADVLAVASRHFSERFYDEVSLGDVASDAGVTVQTVLRHFGSKEQLIAAAVGVGLETVRRERSAAPVGDVEGAIANLVAHYEIWGDRSLLFLAQEGRVAALRELTDAGRALHYEWVERAFEPWLAQVEDDARVRLRARLIAVTDVYVWKVMRRDLGLDATATEVSLRELVLAAVA